MKLIVSVETDESVTTLQEIADVLSAVGQLVQNFEIDYPAINFNVEPEPGGPSTPFRFDFELDI